jgi:hypothetical protein
MNLGTSLYVAAGGWNLGFSARFSRNETQVLELLPKIHEKETKRMFA